MKPIQIISIVGTRPEAIKMAPLAKAISNHPKMEHRLIATGQQFSLFNDAISNFGVHVDQHLGYHPGGDMAKQLISLEASISSRLRSNFPNLVLVQGDTNTALSAARAASKHAIKLGHVEAGLRSFNLERPFPEEGNRIEIAQLASLHFAPSEIAARNLIAEKVGGEIFVTGNPGIDAIMSICASEPVERRANILVTCHRRENFGAPLLRICAALIEIANQTYHTILIPVHPNPNVATPMRSGLLRHPQIELIEPMSYPDMIAAVQKSLFVITDSGGLQEECAALGIPLLLLRQETERPEVITNGNAIIVGSDTNRIVQEALRLFDDANHLLSMSKASFPYGKGDAAKHIIRAIEQHFDLN